ncbi:SpoIIE family protein phosphatase [Streptomyces sp. NPDC006430]|uniref:SpoIIE family protein phosphatase n=1 Tax=Streptomyces sp. NPDC006430 TaxID=3154299 RepID=UPI0033ADA0EE
MLDAHGLIAEWSQEAEALLGYPAHEVVGRPAAGLLTGTSGTTTTGGAAPEAVPVTGGCRVTLRDRAGLPLEAELWVCPRVTEDAALTWTVSLAEARGVDPREYDRAVLGALLSQSPVGLHIVDTDLRLVRFNSASQGMRGVRAEDVIGQRARDVAPGLVTDVIEQILQHVLETGEPVIDFIQPGYPPADPLHERVFSMSAFRLQNPAGDVLGVATVVVDVTDRFRARARLDLLDDASTQIGTTLDVARTAEELAQVAVPRVADAVAVDVLDSVFFGQAPEPGPVTDDVTLRRTAFRTADGYGDGDGAQSAYAIGEKISFDSPTPFTQVLADLRPRLIRHVDGDSEWLARDPTRAVRIREGRVHSLMVVPLTARGVVLGLAGFYRAKGPDPFDEDDLTVATELAARAAVCVDNARRYTREHTAALVLQNSLLPQRLPAQNAVDAAFSYLPAGAGGRPWYDVVPLSGARAAIVVGSIAGHGMHAVATMGRLRAATHSLAALDLAPDEVLAHLNDLMVHLGEEGQQAAAGQPHDDRPTTATCAYAVYDPISRHLVLARAGHPAPLIAYPDGRVEAVDAPEGQPLGANGMPFETAELQLPEGSLIALFNHGLVRGEPDEGLPRLQRLLAHPRSTVQETCDAVIYSELSGRPAEDVVLLVARTRVLGEDQVASWTFPSDPAIVTTARTLADRQLASWKMSDLAFTTELVVSELVTNALRYAGGTIQLRLIRDRALICEVTDGSSAAPHLRHPRTTDEGGRGLLLVTQLTHRWGTRHNPRGKTIWTEQPLPERPTATQPPAADT